MTALGAKKHDKTGRSTGRRKTNARTQLQGQFSPRPTKMQRAPAYRVLNGSELHCLDRLEIELADHGGKDNGKLPCTFDDFEKYGVHRHSIAPALRALAALGLIEITEEGRAGNAEWRRPTLFRLTYRNTETEGSTDEWKGIDTLNDAKTIARAARRASKKQKSSGGNRTTGQCGNRTTNNRIHSAESATTGFSAESATTLYIYEGEAPGPTEGGVRAPINGEDAETHDQGNDSGKFRRFAVTRDGVVIREGVRAGRSPRVESEETRS